MRKVAWSALVLVLVALGAWWASDRAAELVTLEPAGARRIVEPEGPPSALSPGGAVVSERDALGQEAAPPVLEAELEASVPPTHPPLATSTTLVGEVVDTRGDRVSARIEIVHAETGASRATEMALEYRFADVEPGPWWVRVTGVMHASVCERIEIEPGPNRKDFVLPDMRAIEVHLETSSGEPLARALEAAGHGSWRPHVFATLEPPGTERLDGKGDRSGIGWFEDGHRLSPSSPAVPVGPPWGVTGWPELHASPSWVGTLHLSVDTPVYVAAASLPNVLDAVRVEPGTTSVTLHVDVEDLRPAHASLHVRVAAADTGELLTRGWFVQLVSWTTQRSSMPTSDDGYRFDRVPPGRYELQVAYPGFLGRKRTIELAPGEARDAGTLELERIEPLTGRVLDPDGRGVAVKVEVGARGAREGSRFDVRSGEDGRFAFPIGYEDGFVLRVRPTAVEGFDGELASRFVHVGVGSGDFVIRLEHCSRIVLRPTRAGCEGTRYSVVDELGNRYARGVLGDPGPIAIELPVGWYEVVLVDRAGVERRHAVQLGERPSVLDVDGG